MTDVREKLTELLRDKFGARTGWAWPDVADAILAACPELTDAPDKDVVEGAREIANRYFGHITGVTDQPADILADEIAAFATACAAREREACARWHDAQAAENQRIAEIHRENGNWDLRVTFERIANTHRNSAAAIRRRTP